MYVIRSCSRYSTAAIATFTHYPCRHGAEVDEAVLRKPIVDVSSLKYSSICHCDEDNSNTALMLILNALVSRNFTTSGVAFLESGFIVENQVARRQRFARQASPDRRSTRVVLFSAPHATSTDACNRPTCPVDAQGLVVFSDRLVRSFRRDRNLGRCPVGPS